MESPNHEMPKTLGRYRIVRELGKGAMGVVYEGRDPVIGRRVAIKTARRDVLDSSGMANELMERFLREARAAGALNHPNIVTIYDAAEEGGVAYIAMEYVEGGNLQRLMSEKARLDPENVVAIGAAICNALAAAHDRGVVHRDVKPANIMLLGDGTVKVADFGIARVSDSNLTQEGAMIGTPHFMSPEQFMGQKVDGRSDLFSVGVILYAMLTGEKPFTGEAISTVMHQVIKVEPVAPSELNFAVNDALSKVVMKALHKRPAERYQNGRAMAAALTESLKEKPDPVILGLVKAPEAAAPTVVSRHDAATIVSTREPSDTAAQTPFASVPAPPSTPQVAVVPAGKATDPCARIGAGESIISRVSKRRYVVPVTVTISAVVFAVSTYLLVTAPKDDSNGEEGKSGAANISASGTGQSPPTKAATLQQPAIAKIPVTVWLAHTHADFLTMTDRSDPNRFLGKEPGTAEVSVKDAKTGQPVRVIGSKGEPEDSVTIKGDGIITLASKCRQVVVVFASKKYKPTEISVSDDNTSQDVVLDCVDCG